MAKPRILIMAGGTGGHVFPALAVAQALMDEGAEVRWLGTRQGLEAKIVPEKKIPMEWISISGLRGKGVLSWLSAPFKLLNAVVQAVRIMRAYRPNAVLGMGGFVSGPGGLAAWLLRTPLLVHEQNAIAGLTNKLLAPLATKVMQAFPGAFSERANVITTGNPVREEIANIAPPEQRMAGRSGPLRVFVVGGSLGAQALNETIPQALARMDVGARPEVLHQTGLKHLDATTRCYDEAGVTANVQPFIDDMAQAYAWADVVVCRAGALTIAEIAAAGVASILVPFPFAVDDHQTFNAKFLADNGAAILLPQSQLSAEQILGTLAKFSSDQGRVELMGMAVASRRLAKVDATAQVTRLCQEEAHV